MIPIFINTIFVLVFQDQYDGNQTNNNNNILFFIITVKFYKTIKEHIEIS